MLPKRDILEFITMTTKMDFSITQDQENPKQILDKMSQWPSANSWWTPLRKFDVFSVKPCV